MDSLAAYESDGSSSAGAGAAEQSSVPGIGAASGSLLRPPPPFAQPGGAGAGAAGGGAARRVLLHVYIPVAKSGVAGLVKRLLGLARLQLVGKSVKASFAEHDSLHISLSRACAVDAARAPQVVAELRRALAGERAGLVAVDEFVIALPSQNNTRLFTAAPVSGASAQRVVLPLIRAVDRAFVRLALPPFYDNPLPHMSFASTATTAVRDSFPDPAAERKALSGGVEFLADHVVCELGHREHVFPLRND